MLSTLCALFAALPPADEPIRVLFLGDRGHHQPAARFAELAPELARRGIELEYTEDVARLSAAGLGPYDVLAVYANIDELAPAGERALLDFVAGGKGLVALHCASYCFRNSDAWIELVGAQFQSHGTGVFATKVVDFAHPITRGYLAFESWDETYVHTRHNPDRRVLEVREDERGQEPWTWTREHGAGRVFYTAWGHDERTWTNEGFQELVERGIRWAAGRSRPTPLPEPTFVPARIPNYLAGADEARMQEPFAPAESAQLAATAPGVRLELFAAEPLIHSPLAMAWDERGRLFVSESVDYPNELRPEGEGRDRIMRLADTDGDGRADSATTFADGLSLPTSLLWCNGGLIVHQPPRTLFLRDHDGDGVADERRVLLEGWGTGDTHAGPSNLRYGFDNWIWGTVGYSAFRGTVGGERHAFGQAVYRFRPDGSRLEVLCSTSNNTWGLGLSETGEVFTSTANNDQIDYLAIPNRHYESVAGWHGNGWAFIGDYREFHPITDSVRQVDWHDRFTAAAGAALYTARAYPESYWNAVALVCEPTGHLVHRSRLERSGAGYVARDGRNLYASRDEWSAPIAAEVGPDGAVWVLDWYSYVVQHNPTPRGFETGRGSAYVTPHRDREHARIYRLAHRDAPAVAPRDLSRASAAELVATLDDDNLLWRMHAQRLLVERGEHDVAPALVERLAAPRLDGIGSDPGAIHALWTLHGLGALGPEAPDAEALAAARAALEHPAAAVRANAARVLAGDAPSTARLVERLADRDEIVVREALLALAVAPPDEALGARVFELLGDPAFAADRWRVEAATAAAARHDAGFLGAALRATPAEAQAAADPEPENLLPNPSFELARDGRPEGWSPRTYGGRAEHAWAAGEGRFGSACLEIRSEAGSDTSWFTDVEVDPRGTYRLAGWVRTAGVRGAMGGLFNVHLLGQTVTPGVSGDSDWREVEVVFDAEGRERVSLNCLFGGWGTSTGTAWYDDVRLERVRDDAQLARLGEVRGQALASVTRHYASRGPTDSVAHTLARLEGADPGIAGFVLSGLVAGWPQGATPVLDSEHIAAILRLSERLPAAAAADLCTLARRFGLEDATADARRRVSATLARDVADPDRPAAARLAAARALIALEPVEASWAALARELSPAAEPDWNLGLIAALGEAGDARIAPLLLARWPSLTAESARAVVALCLRRATWTQALLDAVEQGAINRASLSAQDWQRLERSPDPALAERARALAAAVGRPTSASRAQVFQRLEPLAAEDGDAARGREVFRKTCLVCHTFAGEGGAVGPALDGVGARGKTDILLEVVDPNRSLEANYQLWVVRTLEGEILTGRIASETRTSFELLDAEGRRTVVERAEVEAMVAQSISIMPEGLVDELPPGDVRDLLQYLVQGAGER